MKNTESKHTPGPWVFAYGSIYRGETFHDESSIRLLCADRNEPHTSPTERDANCALAASAPELLDALTALLTYCEAQNYQIELDKGWGASVVQRTRAALAKAKGQPI